MTVQVCTIVVRNYLPRARVLATPVREHHPLGRVSALVIDDVYTEVDGAEELLKVVRPADIGLTARPSTSASPRRS